MAATADTGVDACFTLAVEMDRLRGRLCGLIEAMNLSEQQTRGAIGTLKILSYHGQETIRLAIEAEREADFSG